MAMLTSNFVYITSNLHPGQWYHYRNDAEELAVWGRLNLIRVYDSYLHFTEFSPPADVTPDRRGGWMRDHVVQCWTEHHLGGNQAETANAAGGHFEHQ